MNIKNITLNELNDLRNNKDYDYLILQGCGGDLQEWKDGIEEILKSEGIIPSDYKFDEVYGFQNNNLTNMAFALKDDCISMSKLVLFRLKIRNDFGAMWLSDYIDNNYLENINI